MRILYGFACLLMAAAPASVLCVPRAFALTSDEICSAMPPENGPAADTLFNQVLAEGDALVFELCDRIGPPEAMPDAGARYALYGLAKHVVGPGREAQRVRVARIFEVALDRAKHPDVRRFFMEQLRFCGDATTVRVLEPYVCDPAVYDDAVRCIAAIGGLQGLGPLLLLDCPDVPDKGTSIQNALMGLNAQPYYNPQETGLNAELLQAAASTHLSCAGAALLLLGGLEGEDVSQALASRLETFNENIRPQVIALLGKRNDATALQAVRDALKNSQIEVRLAAYESVTRHSDPSLTGPLMDALARAESDEEIQAVKAAFLRLPGLESAMQREMLNRPADPGAYTPAEKVAYLEILRERQAAGFREVAVALIDDPDEAVRSAAYAALAVVGEPGDLARLYQYQIAESGESCSEAARAAIPALAGRLNLGEEAVAQAVSRLAGASGGDAARLLKTLGALGTPAALKAVQDAAEKVLFASAPDGDMALAVLETLSGWQNPEGGAALLALWQRLEESSLRLTALKHYIAHVRRTVKEPEQQQERLTGIEGLCKTDAERQEVAGVISKISR